MLTPTLLRHDPAQGLTFSIHFFSRKISVAPPPKHSAGLKPGSSAKG